MSEFGQAFRQSRLARLRDGGSETFQWRGKNYHNYTKAELNEMDNANYNEIAGRLHWKERVSKGKPDKVTDVELSQYSDRKDSRTMKHKQLLNELQSVASQSSTAVNTDSLGMNVKARSPEIISPHRQNARNNDPEFMNALQDINEANLMYRPEKDRMEKSSELTDRMESEIIMAAIAGATGGLGSAALKAVRGGQGLARGAEMLPEAQSYLNNLTTKSKLWKNLLKDGQLQEILNQPYLKEIAKYIP